MPDRELPSKKDVARTLLVHGNVFVHLDARADGVRVPDWLADRSQLVLQVGLDMPVPIPDLEVDDAGITATLSFRRSPFPCVVPWSAVFALVGDDGSGMVWPESLPEDIAAEVERERRRATRPLPAPPVQVPSEGPPAPARAPAPARPPALAVVEGGAEDGDAAPSEAGARARGRKPRALPPYLKVVK